MPLRAARIWHHRQSMEKPTESIRHAATREHHRIMALLDGTLREIAGGDVPGARTTLTAFARRLRTHLRIVDELLLPVVARTVQDHGFAAGLAATREHAVFTELLAEIEDALAHAEPGRVTGNLRELRAALQLHFAREELVLYPMVDRAVQASTVMALAELLAEHPGHA